MHYSENSLTITVNNLTVSYIDEGPTNSPSIIFIHGFPLNKLMWEKQVEILKENYRVIAYDIRGHGNTDMGNDNFSIELFVNDLLSLMDSLKIDRTILCGFSMGGYIALNAIENYPERFNALLLCDTNCAADMPEAKEKRMKTIDIIKEKGLEQKGSIIHIIDHAGHISNLKNSREFNNQLSGFLSLIKHLALPRCGRC